MIIWLNGFVFPFWLSIRVWIISETQFNLPLTSAWLCGRSTVSFVCLWFQKDFHCQKMYVSWLVLLNHCYVAFNNSCGLSKQLHEFLYPLSLWILLSAWWGNLFWKHFLLPLRRKTIYNLYRYGYLGNIYMDRIYVILCNWSNIFQKSDPFYTFF